MSIAAISVVLLHDTPNVIGHFIRCHYDSDGASYNVELWESKGSPPPESMCCVFEQDTLSAA